MLHLEFFSHVSRRAAQDFTLSYLEYQVILSEECETMDGERTCCEFL